MGDEGGWEIKKMREGGTEGGARGQAGAQRPKLHKNVSNNTQHTKLEEETEDVSAFPVELHVTVGLQ